MNDSPSLFASLSALTRERRIIIIARNSDLEDEDTTKRDQRFVLKPGVKGIEIEIHNLTADERAEGEKMFSLITPPRIYRDGKDGSKTPAGWDEEDPEYRARRLTVERNHAAYVALIGCPALFASTAGKDTSEKIKALNAALDERMILFISSSILRFAPAGGDAADFLSTPASVVSPD